MARPAVPARASPGPYALRVVDPSDSVLATEAALGSRAAAWDAVLATVAAAHGLTHLGPAPDLPSLAPWRDPGAVELLAAAHESSVEGRRASGTFYTPATLVDWILDRALPGDPATSCPRVLDPSCGAGEVLVAAARRFLAAGLRPAEAVGLVHGVDLDPVAVAITTLRLRVLAPDATPAVRVGDGLGPHPEAPYDVVVGNPPFLGRLRPPAGSTRPDAVGPDVAGLGAYTDTSAVFLRRALDLVRPGGAVALVQPLSLLAARDAAPVREAVRATGAVESFWSSAVPVFPGTAVLTCVPVVRIGVAQGGVTTWHGPDLGRAPDQRLPEGEWGALGARSAGVPAVTPRTAGTIADLADCTADFRDQYYGLVPHVVDGGPGTPLVTSGLIDPAVCRWGQASTRFAKQRFAAPTVDLGSLHREGSLSAWARARLRPKVLVATQGRTIEAVVDEHGAWLPSVPVLTLAADPRVLWHLLAVLLSPPVVAQAAARFHGTALSPGAIKLSARQVAALPLPADRASWDRGALLAEQAQRADEAGRAGALVACATQMCDAYDDDAALDWWVARLRPV